VGVLIAGINAVFTILSMFTMDRIGRRRMFLIGLPVMIGALVVSAVAFHFMTATTGGELLSSGVSYPHKWTSLMIAGM
jgi:SP family myo-inositol transporter-like MFS transporter 13